MFQFNVCGAESAVLASADFSNGTTNNLKYWGGTSAGGGIVLNSDTPDIRIDVTEGLLNSNFANVYIAVEYAGNVNGGWFGIRYGQNKYSETLYVTENDGVKIFRISDIMGDNECGTYDFAITAMMNEPGNKAPSCDVFVENISIYTDGTKAPVAISSIPVATGNIFYNDETANFEIIYTNRANEIVVCDINYYIYWEDGEGGRTLEETFKEKEASFGADSSVTKKLKYNPKKYGVYSLVVELTGYGNYQVYEIPFSRVKRNAELNYRMGISSHLTSYDDIDKTTDLLVNAGFGNIRDDFHWRAYEQWSPRNQLSERMKGVLTTCDKKGLKLLPIFLLHPSTYFDSNVSLGMDTDEYYNGFGEFVTRILSEPLMSNVGKVEIWNEPDLATYVNGEYTAKRENYPARAAMYGKMVKSAYKAAKAVRPDVKVGIGSFGPDFAMTPFRGYVDGIFDEFDGVQYFDAITLHPYISGSNNSPEKRAINKEIQYYHDLLTGKEIGTVTGNTYSFEDVPFWHTEMGYNTSTLSNPAVKNELMQGAMAIRQCAMMAADYPEDIMYIYKLSNKTNIENDVYDAYGLLRSEKYKVPYSAKASYVQYAWYNYLTANFKNCSRIYEDDECYVYKYECADRDVYMLYTSNNEEEKQIDYTFDSDVVFYDILGNEFSEADVIQDGKLVLTDVPIYAVSDGNLQVSEPTVSFDYNSGKFIISGITENSGDRVSLTVKNGEDIIYLDQMMVEDKAYKFSFSADGKFDGKLCFEIGITEMDKKVMNKNFELFIPQMFVYNSAGNLIGNKDTIPDGKVTVEIKVQNYIEKNYEGVAVFALQRDGKLEMVKMVDVTPDNSAVQNKFLYITDSDLRNGDKIKVFFWNKKTLSPFTMSFSCENTKQNM